MMIIFRILLVLLLAGTVVAQTPVDYAQWRIDDTTLQTNIGGPVFNYKAGSVWTAIDNALIAEGDSVLTCSTAVLKTRVNKAQGKVTISVDHNGNTYEISQKLYGIGWLKMSTGAHQWIDSTMSFGNFTHDSTRGKWANVSPGVDYGVRKGLGTVQHGIFFKPGFLDSAVVLYNQRADSLDIALANVMIYTLSSNIDNADSLLGRVNKRKLKDIGSRLFELTDQRVRIADTVLKTEGVDDIRVEQWWKIIGNKIVCVEFVPMSDLKALHEDHPTRTLWHNTSTDITGSDIEVAGMKASAGYTAFGIATYIDIYGTYRMLIRCTDVSGNLGADQTVTATELKMYPTDRWSSGYYTAHRMLKPWVEGIGNNSVLGSGDAGCNTLRWDMVNAKEWSDDDAACADDDGIDNSTDNAACNQDYRRDRHETALDSLNVTTVDIWWTWDLGATIGAAWYGGTANEEGVLIMPSGDSPDYNFPTDDYTDDTGKRPYFTFTHTGDAEPEATRRRHILLGD